LRRLIEFALATVIGVVDEADVGTDAPCPDRHVERLADHRRAHVSRDLEADQLAREGIDHERHVDDPLPGT
jgi:hypothetical protein